MGIGAEIARARNAAGLTHAELAERTRIRAGIIQAIERDDFSACGGDVFVRGHVKSIAIALDLDPAPLLAALGAVQTPTTFAQEEPAKLDIWELRERTRMPSERRSWALLITLAVVVIGAFIYFARQSAATHELVPAPEPTASATNTPTPTATAGVDATPTATATATPSATPTTASTPDATSAPTPPQETAAADLNGAIVIELTSVSSSWVRITNDVGTLFEGTMQAGETRAISSDTAVRVRIGNAAGIQLTYNGKTYYNLGGPGEVYSHTFNVA